MKNALASCLSALGALLLIGAAPSAQSTLPARGELDEIVLRLDARTGNDWKLGREVVERLRARSELVSAVPDRLRGGGVSPDAALTLIWGLGEVGSTLAQEALTEIHVDGSLRHMDRLRAVLALGGVESPTEGAVLGLWGAAVQRSDPEAVDLSNTALLAIGAAGSRLRGSPERYAGLVGDLVSGLQAARNAPRRVIHLRAIGNLHDPALGPVVADHLADPSAPVRAAAAEALGNLRSSSDVELLTLLLPTEPYGAVRAAMVNALRELPANEASLRAVDRLVRGEPNEEARARMVEYLVEHFDEYEPARATLLERTANDPATRIRILASYALRH